MESIIVVWYTNDVNNIICVCMVVILEFGINVSSNLKSVIVSDLCALTGVEIDNYYAVLQ